MVDVKNIVPNPRDFIKELRDFLLKSNLLSLALAVVIGTGVTKVVNSIVADLIMPIVGVLTPQGDWRLMTLSVWKIHWTLGSFLGTLLDFAILATIVFLITKVFIKQTPPAPTKPCPACKEAVHPEATRCKFCTSEIK
ncbi:MAG TPA: large conductance mechanosensitive channel protein MscL [Planctomycetota bacterium]|jgi:large conductance mechanosensitive channel|nr:large conductance mechanosensitive channel protein MscL [Planctomycetota bacterium]